MSGRRAMGMLAAVAATALLSSTSALAMSAASVRIDVDAKKRITGEIDLQVEPASGSVLFLQRDPFGYQDSVNLYAGMKWDPVNNRDPTGAFVHILWGAGIGTAFGVGIEGLNQVLKGEFNGRRLLAAGVGGGVTGALTAATFGAAGVASAGAIGLSDLAAGGLIGAIAGSSQSIVAGEQRDLTQSATDFMLGAVTLGFGGALERSIRPHASQITAAADDLVRSGETAIADPKTTLSKLSAAQELGAMGTGLELRQQYVKAVEALAGGVPAMRQAGMSSEQIARALHAQRRALGEQFKELTPPARLAEIHERNLRLYGDRLGPSVEWLRDVAKKSWDEIIESASRPGGKDLGL